ncbi:MAG: DUF2085 domain-containing protein [Ignavibacteriae bacterium]|nr:DUF2085 domain-containing protein [Ignavibacteriota bacterium]
MNFLPIFAPIAAHFGLTSISKAIYFVYSFTCHQFHWRSVHIFDYQVAWCTRDMLIWAAFLISALFIRFNKLGKGLNWYWLIPFTIPIAMDGGIQTIATMVGFNQNMQFYLSTNMLRAITGSLFGIGLGTVIGGFLYTEQMAYLGEKVKSLTDIKKYLTIIMIFIIMMVYYVSFVYIWKITSTNYQPANFADHYIREAPDVEDWIDSRKLHGL